VMPWAHNQEDFVASPNLILRVLVWVGVGGYYTFV
jgi:hypothetical protein